MATNYTQQGRAIEVTASKARKSGDLVIEEGFVGIATVDAEATESYTLDMTGVYRLPVDTLAVAKGDLLYISTAEEITKTDTDRLFGKATTAKMTDKTVEVLLLPQQA